MGALGGVPRAGTSHQESGFTFATRHGGRKGGAGRRLSKGSPVLCPPVRGDRMVGRPLAKDVCKRTPHTERPPGHTGLFSQFQKKETETRARDCCDFTLGRKRQTHDWTLSFRLGCPLFPWSKSKPRSTESVQLTSPDPGNGGHGNWRGAQLGIRLRDIMTDTLAERSGRC